ncbi:glycosyltransferase family 4 protein [Flavobacterium aestivum]|uniref:glycosyltransferase family 4 protein n=1 Tax=Flavobacterium aestivum TaxID=3003257 RepID=UPI0024831303|nr:glycosyltransferase family 4 protein [Flavobacterium aestivum]
MEEILIVSNYYPPEKGAAANRIEQLALKLNQNNYNVTVLCPLGNYPKGELFPEYKGKFFVKEMFQNIIVKRLWIYPSNSKNIFIRLISILSFTTCIFFYLLFKKTPHKVVVQSPPLLLSFISVFVLWLKRKKIILNVSDLWPLAAIELKALKVNSLSHKVSLKFEFFIYQKATLILGQSNEIITHVRSLIPNKDCYLYQNFPDHAVNQNDLIPEIKTEKEGTIKLFYAGLLGVAQGVLELCKKIEIDHLNIELHIFGDGAERTQIEEFIKQNPSKKIYFYGMLARQDLHEEIKKLDIAIVPLTTRIYGSVPSKIYEYGALGFPILYFGGGEGETIVSENQLGWVAEVGNYDELNVQIAIISKLSKSEIYEMKNAIVKQSENVFNLNTQMQKLLSKNVF